MKKTLITLAVFMMSNPLWANDIKCGIKLKGEEATTQLEKIEDLDLFTGKIEKLKKASFANVSFSEQTQSIRMVLESYDNEQAISAEEQAQPLYIKLEDLKDEGVKVEDSQAELKCSSKV